MVPIVMKLKIKRLSLEAKIPTLLKNMLSLGGVFDAGFRGEYNVHLAVETLSVILLI